MPEEVWQKAARFLFEDQLPKVNPKDYSPPPAGWGYGHTFSEKPSGICTIPYGSMTSVGIASLLICAERLPKGDPLLKAVPSSVEAGAGWLGKNFAVSNHPGLQRSYLYYYLYSLERAGSFAKVDTFGDHEWYREGAEFIVGQQEENGSWIGPENVEGKVVRTSFALLFLGRASRKTLQYEVADFLDKKSPTYGSVRKIDPLKPEDPTRYKVEDLDPKALHFRTCTSLAASFLDAPADRKPKARSAFLEALCQHPDWLMENWRKAASKRGLPKDEQELLATSLSPLPDQAAEDLILLAGLRTEPFAAILRRVHPEVKP